MAVAKSKVEHPLEEFRVVGFADKPVTPGEIDALFAQMRAVQQKPPRERSGVTEHVLQYAYSILVRMDDEELAPLRDQFRNNVINLIKGSEPYDSQHVQEIFEVDKWQRLWPETTGSSGITETTPPGPVTVVRRVRVPPVRGYVDLLADGRVTGLSPYAMRVLKRQIRQSRPHRTVSEPYKSRLVDLRTDLDEKSAATSKSAGRKTTVAASPKGTAGGPITKNNH